MLAGGQSLLATLGFRLSAPSRLVDITRVAELRGVSITGRTPRIGALTRHAELARDPLVAAHAPMLAQAAPLIAQPAIHNRGGGSLAMADPAAELPACAVALEATPVLASARGERRVAAESFFVGAMSTTLGPGEIVSAAEFPVPADGETQSITAIARRSGDFAMAGLCQRHGPDMAGTRLVFFGVGDAPRRARAATAALDGRPLTPDSLAAAQAALAADLDPRADFHGGPEVKRHLARVPGPHDAVAPATLSQASPTAQHPAADGCRR